MLNELVEKVVIGAHTVATALVPHELSAMVLTILLTATVIGTVLTPFVYFFVLRVATWLAGPGLPRHRPESLLNRLQSACCGLCRCCRRPVKPMVLKLRVAGESHWRRLEVPGVGALTLSILRAAVTDKLAAAPAADRTADDMRAAKLVALVSLPDGVLLSDDRDVGVLKPGGEVEAALKYG